MKNVVATLKPLVGLRLQEVLTSEQDVVLGFYSSDGLLWLWIDLNAVSPCVLPWSELPLKPKPAKTPLLLFLRAHFVDHTMVGLAFNPGDGRVVELDFSDERRLTLRLFPHGRNLIAEADAKHISWQRIAPLPEGGEARVEGGRSLEDLRREWLEQRGRARGGRRPVDMKGKLEAEIARKGKAIGKVREELQRKQDLPWKEVGDWLKTHQSLAVPREWEAFVDKRRKLSWNIEQCFTKAREVDGKLFGTEKRLALLLSEVADLERRLSGPLRDVPPPADHKRKISLGDIEAQGRTLRLSDDLTAVMGKSAADNLKILRKARAWDLWFHLRDYPSSHAVLFRNKTARITDAVLLSVADWYVRQYLAGKAARHAGEKFAIVVTECRFVRPIKGDKIGRVTYHEERVLTYQLPD